jgi:hypothetical protein
VSKKRPAGRNSRAQKILINGINLTPIFKGISVSLDAGLRAHFTEMRKTLSQLERVRKALEETMKKLEGQDEVGNFQIQQLMNVHNQNEMLSSSLSKKMADTMSCLVHRV